MPLIFEDNRKRTIKIREEITFTGFSSYYLIVLTARVKSEKQLGQEATDDEDLILNLDNRTFPQYNSDRLIDSPAAFSGGKLHNLAKTVYLLTFLKGKKHTLILETDDPFHAAIFERLKIYTLHLEENLTLEVKMRAEDGDRRAWLTFAFDNFSLKSITPTITYSRRKRDSDDVKIKIDGKAQENIIRTIKHFLWRFAGSLLPWVSPTKTETQILSVNLSQGLHYLEFDADRMPLLENLAINFGEKLPIPAGVPTVDNPAWTGNFYDDTEVMLLARAVYGEAGGENEESKIAVAWAIRNRVEDSKNRWGITYHEVILVKYQYEAFSDPGSDAFKKITQPPLGNSLEKRAWLDSYNVAELVFLDKQADPAGGANHFYVPSNQPKPDWVDEEKFTVQIGVTRFYKL